MDEMTTLGFNVEAGLGQNGCFYNTLIHKTLIKIEFNLSETINVRVYPYIYIDIKLSYLYFCFYTAKSIDICCF